MPSDRSRLKAAADALGLPSARAYEAARKAGTVPGLRDVLGAAAKAPRATRPEAPASSGSRWKTPKEAERRAAKDARARELGYRNASHMNRARKAGRPMPGDAGARVRRARAGDRLPSGAERRVGFTVATFDKGDAPATRRSAEGALEGALSAAGPSARVTITVALTSGKHITVTPAGGLTVQQYRASVASHGSRDAYVAAATAIAVKSPTFGDEADFDSYTVHVSEG